MKTEQMTLAVSSPNADGRGVVQSESVTAIMRLVENGHRKFASAKIKSSAEWQECQWARWPNEGAWPARLDIYEAAAYLRVSPHTIRRFLAVARDGKARLAHQRVGAVYRIRRVDLDAIGSVTGRF